MFKLLKPYIKKNLGSILLALLIVIVNVGAVTLIPYLIGEEIDEIGKYIASISSNSLTSFTWVRFETLLIYIFVLIVVLVICQYIFETLLGILSERISMDLRNEVFSKIVHSNINFVDSNKHGDLISLVINDIDNVNLGLQSGLKQFYQGVIQVIITLVVMFVINWILGLVVIVFTPFGFLLSYMVAKKSKKYFRNQAKIVGENNGIFLEFINNIETVKAFEYGDTFYSKYEKKNAELYKVGQKAQFIGALTNPSTRLINNSIYGIVGTLGVLLAILAKDTNGVILGANASIGIVSTFLQYSNQFAKPFNEISSCISELQTASASSARLLKIINLDKEIDEGTKEIPEKIETISFNHVKFGYEENHVILKDVDISIKNGQKVAIVGPTGCGKTTLINLLLRFYDPLDGSIKINDLDLKDISKNSLRSSFGLVLQDSWIFKGTVLENITYNSKDKSLEKAREVCERANCLSFIERLPQGFDTVISEDSGLSSGQKQLISIARVMMSDPKIIVLDEATSNIDTRTESKIIKSLENLTKGRTSFVIAHRLNTIINSDLILVLKDGVIYEAGNHEELLKKNGFYHNLFYAQFDH